MLACRPNICLVLFVCFPIWLLYHAKTMFCCLWNDQMRNWWEKVQTAGIKCPLSCERRITLCGPLTYPPSHLGNLPSMLIRGNNYQSGQVIKLKHKWLHEPGWLYYKAFPGLIKEKYGSARPQCHRAGINEEKKPSSHQL